MGSSAAVTTLGLMHMRLLHYWLHAYVPKWTWHCGMQHKVILLECCHAFSPWKDFAFLQTGVPLKQVPTHIVVSMDAFQAGVLCAMGTQLWAPGQVLVCTGI